MTETTLAYLNAILSKYTPGSNDFEKARTHRAGIQARLDNWLGLNEVFETGSLRHGTGVWHYSDVDYLASLKGSRPSPTAALNNIRDALKDKYPYTTVRVSRPAVVCEFASAAETVEVVPAFPDTLGGGYWIPDPTNQNDWMKSFPKDQNTYVNGANSKHSGAAKKLARLAKTWKYKRSVPISSCYLEMRAAKYTKDVSSWILPMDLTLFFRQLKSVSLAAMNDPTGLGSRYTACSSVSHRSDALSKLDTALIRANKAYEHYLDEKHADAITQWKLVFGQ